MIKTKNIIVRFWENDPNPLSFKKIPKDINLNNMSKEDLDFLIEKLSLGYDSLFIFGTIKKISYDSSKDKGDIEYIRIEETEIRG